MATFTLVIEIDLESPESSEYEAADVLTTALDKLASRIEPDDMTSRGPRPVQNVNGSSIGHWSIER